MDLGQGHGMGTWSWDRNMAWAHGARAGTWSWDTVWGHSAGMETQHWDGDTAWGPGARAGTWQGDWELGCGMGTWDRDRGTWHQDLRISGGIQAIKQGVGMGEGTPGPAGGHSGEP